MKTPKKAKLKDIEVKSFVTLIDREKVTEIKGGTHLPPNCGANPTWQQPLSDPRICIVEC